MKNYFKRRVFAPLLVIFFIAVVAGAAGYVALRKDKKTEPEKESFSIGPSENKKTEPEEVLFSIRPSENKNGWLTYVGGAKAILEGENLSSVEIRYMPTGTGMGEEYPDGYVMGRAAQVGSTTWELLLPESLLTTNVWAVAKDNSGKILKSNDLGKVIYAGSSDWKVYVNTRHGFEFKYPSNYLLVENGTEISIKSSEICVSAEGIMWPKDCLLYNLLIQENKIQIEGAGVTKEMVQVAGYSAEKIEDENQGIYEGMVQTTVQFSRNNRWYISRISFGSHNNAGAKGLLDQILSTFKFND